MDPRYTLRPIRPDDDAAVARIIRTVMPELGADGPGFAIHDAEVDGMCAAYSGPRARYFVVADGERVVGGGGVAPLPEPMGATGHFGCNRYYALALGAS